MIELLYFTSKSCGVCEVLKPILLNAVRDQFPDISIRIVDIEEEPELAGQSMVFTLPVVILKLENIEVKRFARSFSVGEVLSTLERLNMENSIM